MSPGDKKNYEQNIDDERVREHLANERTYLAWTRTGISLMGFGVVIAKLRYLFAAVSMHVTPGIIHASDIGVVFTIAGLGLVLMAAWRYSLIQEQIRQRNYRSSKGFVLIVSGIVSMLGMAIIWYLIQSA